MDNACHCQLKPNTSLTLFVFIQLNWQKYILMTWKSKKKWSKNSLEPSVIPKKAQTLYDISMLSFK